MAQGLFPLAQTTFPFEQGLFPFAQTVCPFAQAIFPFAQTAIPIGNGLFSSLLCENPTPKPAAGGQLTNKP